ncbi:MAG: FAD-dependent oxidoreductase [Candidatus Methylacidiphilales bacterium]|nr:FAD-dependent oxidoreductase [Candidatus Methylacidiphilales bacterium]
MNSHLSFYEEPSRQLPILDEADVLVLGGGPGGIGAAVAAARTGARTILVERSGNFGGMWTSGILGAIMPSPFVRGLFEELVAKFSERNGWNQWGAEYGGGGTYDIETAKIVLDETVVESGVIPYFYTHFSDVIRQGKRVTGAIVECKEGRRVIRARQFIDSTGDGDVSVRAGASFDKGRDSDGKTQPMTMIFMIDRVDNDNISPWWHEQPECLQAWRDAKARGEVTVPREDVLAFQMPRKGQWTINTTRVIGKDGTRIRDLTDATIEARRQVGEVMSFLRKYVRGLENAVLLETAPQIGVRETRRIHCDYTITLDDILKVPACEDCIARGSNFVDIHNPSGEGTTLMHPPAGSWYEIPYRSIRVRGIDNLLVASRCVDSTHEAHAAIRVTNQIMTIGQGAGTAAALCANAGISTRELEAPLLRKTLRSMGAFV